MAADQRTQGDVPVFGSNGCVGSHAESNTQAPVIVIGRKGSYGKLQFSDRPVYAIDTTYFVDGTKTAHHIRWLYYALSTLGLDSLSNDVGVPGLSRETAYELRVPLPPAPSQAAIADLLDLETSRIDAVVAAKRRLIEVLVERFQAAVEDYVWRGDVVELKRVAGLQAGYTFSSDDFSPEQHGPRLLRGINVSVGAVRWDDLVRLRPGMEVSPAYRLHRGDLVLGMDRPFVSGGTRVAVVEPDDEGSLLVQRVCRIRPATSTASVLLKAALASPRFAAYIEPDLTGVSVPHLSEDQIGRYLVPAVCAREATGDAKAIETMGASTSSLVVSLTRQIDLLLEHRQALITAAVTGELEIPGVAA